MNWLATLDEDRGGTAAWVVSLSSKGALQRPKPNARDWHDLGGRRDDDASRFLARRSVLRGLVARRCDARPETVVIGYGEGGRPLVLSPPDRLYCSVAARGDVAAFALSHTQVGIDIEPVEGGDIPWAALAFEEAALLRSRPEAERTEAFLRIWTGKEAYLKARGSGLLADPAQVVVSLPNRTIRDRAENDFSQTFASTRFAIGERAIAAACVSLGSGAV